MPASMKMDIRRNHNPSGNTYRPRLGRVARFSTVCTLYRAIWETMSAVFKGWGSALNPSVLWVDHHVPFQSSPVVSAHEPSCRRRESPQS